MFIWKTLSILKAIKKCMPNLYGTLEKIKENFDSDNIEKVLYYEYSKLESISIDYGVMEKVQNIYM